VSTHDDDILDFDFVEEDATREDQSRKGRPPERRPPGRGGGPRRPPALRGPGGFTPLVRLVGLIGFAIIVVVLLVIWVQGCANDHKRGAYANYMSDVDQVGSDSAKVGADLAELLTTPGLKVTDVVSRLDGLIQRQQQDVARAQKLDPPGPLHPEHEHAVDALQLRVRGLQGLKQAFQSTATSSNTVQAGQLLAVRAERLLASDIIWSDLFKGPAEAELQSRDISAVTVPGSTFVSNVDLYGAKSLTLVVQRVHGASTGGTPSGRHGTNVEYVKLLPSGEQLSTSNEKTVKISEQLGFVVGVTNGGDSQEVHIEVTLTIPTQPRAIVKKGTIAVIDPGETKTVTFKNFGDLPAGEQLSLKVDVKPVKGEQITSNNTYEYPILTTI
jgi:hypothetical protein